MKELLQAFKIIYSIYEKYSDDAEAERILMEETSKIKQESTADLDESMSMKSVKDSSQKVSTVVTKKIVKKKSKEDDDYYEESSRRGKKR